MLALISTTTGFAARSPPPRMQEAAVAATRSAGWLPGAVAPSYLDGSLVGDVGFDPLCLAALAPTGARVDTEWEGIDRTKRMLMASEYEQRRKVLWM